MLSRTTSNATLPTIVTRRGRCYRLPDAFLCDVPFGPAVLWVSGFVVGFGSFGVDVDREVAARVGNCFDLDVIVTDFLNDGHSSAM